MVMTTFYLASEQSMHSMTYATYQINPSVNGADGWTAIIGH